MYQKIKEDAVHEWGYSSGASTRPRSQPPGPERVSLANVAPFMKHSMYLAFDELAAKYGSVYQLSIKGGNLLVLSGLATVWEALVNQDGVFEDRAEFDILKQPPQCHFLELKSGDFFKRHRDIFVSSLRTYFSNRLPEVEGWLQKEAAALADEVAGKRGEPFDPTHCLAYANLSFIQRLVYGRKCSEEDRRAFNADGLTLLPNNVTNAISFGLLPGFWKVLFFFFRMRNMIGFRKDIDDLNTYIDMNVQHHRQTYNPETMRDMCDHLLHAGLALPAEERAAFRLHDKDIVNGSLTQFIGAGVGLPTIALHWVLYYLMKYPGVQIELHRELDAVLDCAPKMSDRSRLPYMQAFVSEVLRHAPLITMPAVHYRTRCDTTINGFFVEKDTPVMVNYYSVTRDQAVWQDPESFDPGRFVDSDGKFRKELQNKFFPFGLGARRCVGEHIGRMQIFLLCAHLVYKFNFCHPAGGDSAEVLPGMVPVLKNCHVVATRRK